MFLYKSFFLRQQLTGIDDVVALGSRLHTEGDYFFPSADFFYQQRCDHNFGPSVPISFRRHENHQRTPSNSVWRLQEVLEKADTLKFTLKTLINTRIYHCNPSTESTLHWNSNSKCLCFLILVVTGLLTFSRTSWSRQEDLEGVLWWFSCLRKLIGTLGPKLRSQRCW